MFPYGVLQIPEGKDPDEYVRTHGAEKFRHLMDQAISVLSFRLLLKQRANPGQEVADRVALLTGMAGSTGLA